MMSHRELSSWLRAVIAGDEAKVKVFLASGVSLDETDYLGNSALLLATREGHERIVLLLLAKKAPVSQTNQHDVSPMMMAALRGYQRICHLLYLNGADFRTFNAMGHSAWSKAAALGHIEVLKYFFARGLSVNAKTPAGDTPLMMAAAANQPEVVNWMLNSHGIVFLERNNAGKTAFDLAKENGRTGVIEVLEQYYWACLPKHPYALRFRRLLAKRKQVAAKSAQAASVASHPATNSSQPSIDALAQALGEASSLSSAPRQQRRSILLDFSSEDNEVDDEEETVDGEETFNPQVPLLPYETKQTIGLPEKITNLLLAIQALGYTALCVGGCVRNVLIGKTPRDYDLVTNCPKAVLENHFSTTKNTPIGYCLKICVDGEWVDVAIHDFFDLKEDTLKRDFTINALYADPHGRVLDPLKQGLADLQEKQLVMIGDACDRIEEDPLRLLRAARLHADYGFALPAEFQALVRIWSPAIELLHPLRLRLEFKKHFLQGNAVTHLTTMTHLDLLDKMFPYNAAICAHFPYYQTWLTQQLSITDNRVNHRFPVSFYYVLALFLVGEYFALFDPTVTIHGAIYLALEEQRCFTIHPNQDAFQLLQTTRLQLLTKLSTAVQEGRDLGMLVDEATIFYQPCRLRLLSTEQQQVYFQWQQSQEAVSAHRHHLTQQFAPWCDFSVMAESDVLAWLAEHQWLTEYHALLSAIHHRDTWAQEWYQVCSTPVVIHMFLQQLLQEPRFHLGWRLLLCYADITQQPLTVVQQNIQTTQYETLAQTHMPLSRYRCILWRNQQCHALQEQVLPPVSQSRVQRLFQLTPESMQRLEGQAKHLARQCLSQSSSTAFARQTLG